MKLRFYKKNDRWYADVPGHTEEENEMVCGSDLLLDNLSRRMKSESFVITISNKPSRETMLVCTLKNHDKDGAEYYTYSSDPSLNRQTIWICNVTHDVLGEHPQYFYIDNE